MSDQHYDRDQEVRAIKEAAERMAKRLNARVEINPTHLEDFGAFGSGDANRVGQQSTDQEGLDPALKC